jgi:hypothetical protein
MILPARFLRLMAVDASLGAAAGALTAAATTDDACPSFFTIRKFSAPMSINRSSLNVKLVDPGGALAALALPDAAMGAFIGGGGATGRPRPLASITGFNRCGRMPPLPAASSSTVPPAAETQLQYMPA